MAMLEDTLGTDLDPGPGSEFSSPLYSNSPLLGLECSEPDAFDLVGDYLISFFFNTAITDISSPTQSVATIAVSEMGPQGILCVREDHVVKVIRTAHGVCHRMTNFLKSKTKRSKLGFAFNRFLQNTSQAKDDFLTSLGRDFIKKICFCVRAEKFGFEKVFKESAKLHSSGTKNVKVPASQTTKDLYKRLFSLYLTIPDRKILYSYERSISVIKKEKNYKSFNVEFQKYFYAPKKVRLFYRHYVEFLDWFGQKGNGVKLHQEMRFKTVKPMVVKEEITYGYLQALGLRPVDKLTKEEVFSIELEP